MDFELRNVLQVVGPNAGLVFASWMFMHLLQARYTSAYTHFRELVDNYRQGLDGKRKETIRDEIKLYRQRVDIMRRATDFGLYAAMLLITTLLVGVADAIFQGMALLKYAGTFSTVAGLGMVIWAAGLVVRENKLIKMPLDREMEDMPELAEYMDKRHS